MPFWITTTLPKRFKMLPIQGRLIILTAAIVGLLFGLHDLHISNTDPALGKVTGLSTVVKDSWTDQLTKRSKDTKYGPTQLSFNDAVRKGEIWIASLPGPPATNQRTQFTDFGQLATYGWGEEEKHEETDGSAELIELGDPLTANGITDKSRFQASKELSAALM